MRCVFENSAAYLRFMDSESYESDPRLIVSAALGRHSGPAISSRGIEHKESLQECQISPKECRSTWAR